MKTLHKGLVDVGYNQLFFIFVFVYVFVKNFMIGRLLCVYDKIEMLFLFYPDCSALT
jgi:hypothetical protein